MPYHSELPPKISTRAYKYSLTMLFLMAQMIQTLGGTGCSHDAHECGRKRPWELGFKREPEDTICFWEERRNMVWDFDSGQGIWYF